MAEGRNASPIMNSPILNAKTIFLLESSFILSRYLSLSLSLFLSLSCTTIYLIQREYIITENLFYQ